MITSKSWIIYGATGYTGRLIAQEAKRRGLAAILAGRNAIETKKLAHELGFESRVFECSNPEEICKGISGAQLVLHCAGPFSATSHPMVEACIESKVHYLDITGEIPVFERIHQSAERFVQAGIVAIPGVGFDVVPSDCMAALLKQELPDALSLKIALKFAASPSQGTSKTMVEGLYAGTIVRRNSRLERLPSGTLKGSVRFWDSKRERPTIAISWGDVSTAFYSTGIPNIETYLAPDPYFAAFLKSLRYFSPLLAQPLVQGFLKKQVELWVKPPSEEQRAHAPYYLWARVENQQGVSKVIQLKTPNGYTLTVDAALAAVTRVQKGDVKPGAWTPSRAFGADFVSTLSGVELRRS